jgi:SAM-dependent methyltransferase
MDYSTYDPARYATDPALARPRGTADWQSIRDWVGSERNQRLLEVGCGCGQLLFVLGEKGFQNATGLEVNAELARAGQTELGVAIAVGEWRDFLGKTSDSFDVLIALDVLEHVKRQDLLTTLTASCQRLRPGGRLILRVPNALCPLATATFWGDLDHQFLAVPRTLQNLLVAAGFRGPISVRETRPNGRLKRLLHGIVHRLVVRPIWGIIHYHFHGEFPTHLTPNILCCAYLDSASGSLSSS